MKGVDGIDELTIYIFARSAIRGLREKGERERERRVKPPPRSEHEKTKEGRKTEGVAKLPRAALCACRRAAST